MERHRSGLRVLGLYRQLSSTIEKGEPWPTHIKHLKASRALEIGFTDGNVFRLPVELIRVLSPAANSLRHQQVVVAGRRYVSIMGVERVGNYALRFKFDDLHSTGLYTWAQLHDLGKNKIAHIRAYLKLLRSQGLSRDPRAQTSSKATKVTKEKPV